MLVSFDFDDTLLLGTEANPIMLEALRRHAAAGDTVIIVTSRNRHHDRRSWIRKYSPSRISVRAFVEIHDLPVAEIYFTNHRPKGPKLLEVQAGLHYDNDPLEIESCLQHGVQGVLHIYSNESPPPSAARPG